MIIGVDFDNTIVQYDDLFHLLALERGLIPPDLPPTKQSVRNYLREIGREPAWTELQGSTYGPQLHRAIPFPGVLDFFTQCRTRNIEVFIVSHKTRFPIIGPQHDLHAAANDWLAANGFYDAARGGLTRRRVHFDLTKDAKLDRIAFLRCTHFIDDLPEFLAEPTFPSGVHRVLFDPNGSQLPADSPFVSVSSWPELKAMLIG